MVRVIIKISTIIFLVEGLIMMGFSVFGVPDTITRTIMDSLILVLISSPIIYLFVILPYVD